MSETKTMSQIIHQTIATMYEPNKIFSLWRYEAFRIQSSKEPVKQPYCLTQNTIFILKILKLPW